MWPAVVVVVLVVARVVVARVVVARVAADDAGAGLGATKQTTNDVASAGAAVAVAAGR